MRIDNVLFHLTKDFQTENVKRFILEMNLFKEYSICLFVFMVLQRIPKSKQNESNANLIFEISEQIDGLDTRSEGPHILQTTKFKNPTYKKKNLNLQLKNYLRDSGGNLNDPIVDRICKKTGCSCGRSSLLCDAKDVFEIANDVVNVIDDINRKVDKDYDDTNVLLRCAKNECKKYHYGNFFTENDDSFTDDFIVDSKEQNTRDQTLLEAVISELNDVTNKNSAENQKLASPVSLTPDDMYNYYRSAMDELRNTLMGFIKYRTGFKVVRGLPKDVRSEIQTIRDKYRHFKMSDKTLKKQIFKVLLDDMLKIKIIPNKDQQVSYDVFIPDWIFMEVLKKKEGQRLRTDKRVLPLTTQQKTRLQNKQAAKKITKFVWRRSLDSKLNQYGVPFVLDIQGLGQIN